MELEYGQLAAWLSCACFIAAAVGCFYALAVAWLACRLRGEPTESTCACPPVTILKPLRGGEPELYANLLSFCVQDYPAPVQIVFGVHDASDPAVAVVHRLMDQFPELDLELVVDPRRYGANSKISNLINMSDRTRHDILVVSDSDIRVEADYLRRVVPPLTQSGVGVVTCLYRGASTSGPWAQLSAQAIDHHFLPSVLLAVELDLAHPCLGSTIALRTDTLSRMGGFEAFGEQLADDYALGEAVRRFGLEIVIAPCVVTHYCTEATIGDLMRHEWRWARTIRLLAPIGFLGSSLTHALPFALLGAAIDGFAPAGLVMIASALASRLILQIHMDEALGVEEDRAWWGPVRDLLSFVIFVTSFFGNDVTWRGQRFSVRADGTLVYIADSAR